MSTKSEEETFEADMEELVEEEFPEEAEEEEDEDREADRKSDSSEKASKKSESQEVKNQGNTVDRYFWVDNIKPGTKTEKVQDLFKKYGNVLAVKVIRGGSDGNLLAFIKFETPSDAQNCLDKLDGTEFNGNTIKIIRERPTMPEDSKSETKRGPTKRSFSPRRGYSPRRSSDYRRGERSFRGSYSGGRGSYRGGFRDRGGHFRDGGYDRDYRRDYSRERSESFAERRLREQEIRREREFFVLEKERLEVEKLKLKREREELEKLSTEMSSERSFSDHKRPKNFDNFSGDSRRFDDYGRRDEMKRSDRFSSDRDRGPSRFSSSASGSAGLAGATSQRSGNRFSSSANDRSYDQKPSWSSNSWDNHSSSNSHPQSHRGPWQSSSSFASNGNSHNDRGRYSNGNSSGLGPQRLSSSNNDRGFSNSYGGSGRRF